MDGDETAKEIYQFMQEDFQIDMPSIIDYKKGVSEEKWVVIDETARQFYTDYAKGSADSIDESMKVINKITAKTFGYKDSYFEKRKNPISRTKGLICRWFTNIAYVLYILCAISFGVSVLYFFLQYVSLK
ncbi:MAG: hypothetical protein IPI88_19035 [Chitinophagaceae bacterium]|nr:hypothetical protein [Chitinophagaceae bacterium]